MSINPAYPETRHDVAQAVDLSDRAERERLSSDAVRAFFNIMACWKIRDDDARRLLGSISNGTYYALKKGSSRALNEDRLRRISYLVGIFKALNILYSEGLADVWMQRPNSDRIFGGMTPCQYLGADYRPSRPCEGFWMHGGAAVEESGSFADSTTRYAPADSL